MVLDIKASVLFMVLDFADSFQYRCLIARVKGVLTAGRKYVYSRVSKLIGIGGVYLRHFGCLVYDRKWCVTSRSS